MIKGKYWRWILTDFEHNNCEHWSLGSANTWAYRIQVWSWYLPEAKAEVRCFKCGLKGKLALLTFYEIYATERLKYLLGFFHLILTMVFSVPHKHQISPTVQSHAAALAEVTPWLAQSRCSRYWFTNLSMPAPVLRGLWDSS